MNKEVKKLLGVFLAVIIIAGAVGAFFAFTQQPSGPVVLDTSVPTSAPSSAPVSPAHSMVLNLVREDSFAAGPKEAKVTVVEFFDPECETCAKVAPYIKNEMKHYGDQVRWVFRYMPYHFNSKTAIAALESARLQNRFLEVQHALFERQHEWGEKRVSTEKEILNIVFSVPGINKTKFMKDFKEIDHQKIIDRDKFDGEQAQIRGTPSFFVNGLMLQELDLDALIAMIETELKR